jgi:hypothetical protein
MASERGDLIAAKQLAVRPAPSEPWPFVMARLAVAESDNRAGDHAAAKRIIGTTKTLTPEEAADLALDLRDLGEEVGCHQETWLGTRYLVQSDHRYSHLTSNSLILSDMMNEDNELTPSALYDKMYHEVAPRIIKGPWHWFHWLFSRGPEHPFVSSLISACVECERKLPGLGWMFINDIASTSGREKHAPDYEALLQKLSEILIIKQLRYMPWPDGTTFEHEPNAEPGGKRPELKVETLDSVFLFEVKAPSLLSHQRARANNPIQFPGRMFENGMRKAIASDQKPTLPRDNPVKDFLISAEAKFAPFHSQKTMFGVLIIVWDDFIFEPITTLIHEPSKGLLTVASFARNADSSPIRFPHVDGIIIVRHLLYFQQAAAETLTERQHAFDFGGADALSNVLVPVPGGKEIPMIIRAGLRAFPYDDSILQKFADYHPQEFVMWFNT